MAKKKDKKNESPDDFLREIAEQQAKHVEEARQVFVKACDRLAKLGIDLVRLAYDGCGDDGAVQEIQALNLSGENVNLPSDLACELVDAAERILPAGWEINEGAFGELVLEVPARHLTRDHHWRIESTEDEQEGFDL